MMRLRLPRKAHVLVVGSVIVLNVICFLTIGRVTMSRVSMSQVARQVFLLDNSSDVSSRTRRTGMTTSSHRVTVNPKTKLKLDKVRGYLNESTLTNDSYPAMKIGRYLMVNPNLCKGVDKVDVIILVHTSPSHLEKRQRMRDSFAKDSLFFPFHIRIAFLLGRTWNTTLQRVLWLEHATHNDTVMGDFIDDYHNLTLKGVMGYRWVSEHCSNSKYVLKIDDDVLVNMYKLLYSFSGHLHGKKKSIFCNVWFRSTMLILRTGKWKVANNIFRNMNAFPYDYCSGFIVILSSDLMRPLYEAAKITPFFWIDDVYLFGILPKVVGGVTYYNYALDKNVTLDDKKAIACTKEQGPKCPIFATLIAPKSYWSYWEMIQAIYSSGSWNVQRKLVE